MSDPLNISEKANKLLEEANKAAEKSQWDTAIRCLRKVIRLEGKKTPQVVRGYLASCLNERAVDAEKRAKILLDEAHKSSFAKIIHDNWV